jgi:hypothetical protein
MLAEYNRNAEPEPPYTTGQVFAEQNSPNCTYKAHHFSFHLSFKVYIGIKLCFNKLKVTLGGF